MTAGAGRNVTWNNFDMPVQISRTTAAGGTVSSSFVYGAEHQRLRQDRSDGSKIIYAGAQEVEVSAAGLSTVKTYWPHGIGVEIDRPGAATTELNWVHHDRLGSPVAITDQNGSLKEKLAYDAWGKRRSLDGSSIADSIVGVTDNKGFTGHEMLEALELVHMNGRVYDPLVGRFMSGDPHITDLINGQNHNRYSYVLNNPTNLTDPTGFDVVIVTGDRCLICKALEATSGVWEYTKVAAKNVEKAVSRTIPVVKKIIPVAIKRVVKTQAVLAIPGAGEVLDGLLTADIVYEASKEIYQAATNDDTKDNLSAVIDPTNNRTDFSYDALGRLLSSRNPMQLKTINQYDKKGNLTATTDAKQQTTTLLYDGLNRLNKTGFADGNATTYSYDSANRISLISDTGSGNISRSYDAFDHLIRETTAQGSISYSYDSAGRRTGMQITGQSPVSYSYDDASRLTRIQQDNAIVSFSYDDGDRRTSMTLPNGIVASYSYDQSSQLSAIVYNKSDGSVIGDLRYSYDAGGRRIAIEGSLAKFDLPSNVNSSSYDTHNRLTAWNGNTLSYDPNGNLLSDGQRNYLWDARNRLSNISDNSGNTSASFDYDALQRRIGKTIGGQKTVYLYDGYNPVQELSNAQAQANILGGLGIDEIFRRTDSNGSRDYLSDALGTIIGLTDGSGELRTQYSYTPYGQTKVQGEESGNAFQYTGRENDGNGLYYYRARYYSPELSRFIASDPIGLNGGVNTYAYVEGNPTSLIDPSGELGLIGFGIGAGLEVAQEMLWQHKSWRCVNIGNVVISGAIGATSPGLFTVVKSGLGKEVAVAFVGFTFKDLAKWQGMMMFNKTLLDKAAARAKWTIGSDCECS
ncbi:RHS repeat-associated core domain-containing protein [Undibacterium sp. MH2W]|uniref:RHS repeat-associated core domain-containing protein n=1 Tax=Undibacterium sp. MH2W TaxID=3413044 RepID=UPI003BF3CF15